MAACLFEESREVLSHSNLVSREVEIGWVPLAEGWIKCNTDGTSSEDSFAASYGGLLRDSSG